ncbi:uncharacterized protein LOC128746086 [Sabethes cyaneus]|uniref:uncharacterized protein LOC128746086 n=1 Tax=Sabethes cyaneus TaxID=53552 RepID=UPI00237E544D|nr:uncharacterized protein LOC128746086 [Sabethes cyaneus]
MAMFDPQGLLSPFTVFGRMLVQDLWRTGCEWDEEIDDESFQKWTRWTKVLPMIEEIRIPRSYFGDAVTDQIKDLQLHVVSDASKGAYGCAAYFRAVIGGTVQCVLVTSRVKVAPLKPISVPRLELQAAVLGARIASAVRDGHSLEIRQRFFWTDSTTVLSWIRSDQRKYKEFVGLRIGEILTCTNLSEWRWVPTRMNIADQLTKWTKDPEDEFERAEIWLMRMAQVAAFDDELKILLKNSELPTGQWLEIEKSSLLYKLTPLIDENGLLRMEGRTGPADFLPFDLRFPVILPTDHPVTWKIVQHYHERFGHGYRETVKNELRQRFAIPKLIRGSRISLTGFDLQEEVKRI